jgi:hypothetical protein
LKGVGNTGRMATKLRQIFPILREADKCFGIYVLVNPWRVRRGGGERVRIHHDPMIHAVRLPSCLINVFSM